MYVQRPEFSNMKIMVAVKRVVDYNARIRVKADKASKTESQHVFAAFCVTDVQCIVKDSSDKFEPDPPPRLSTLHSFPVILSRCRAVHLVFEAR